MPCDLLEVAKSGYYARRARSTSARRSKTSLRQLGLYGLLARSTDIANKPWIDELLQIEEERQRRLRRYTLHKLPCVDEVGYLSYSNRYADLLFEVVTRRYDLHRSIVLSTNKLSPNGRKSSRMRPAP